VVDREYSLTQQKRELVKYLQMGMLIPTEFWLVVSYQSAKENICNNDRI
jgi:hypothetical protein